MELSRFLVQPGQLEWKIGDTISLVLTDDGVFMINKEKVTTKEVYTALREYFEAT